MQEREPGKEVRAVPEERAMGREEMMAGNVTPMARTAYVPAWYNRVSLSSVFVGAFIAFASWVTLILLGYAIGFGIPAVGSIAGLRSIGIGVGIWVAISGVIAFFLGSYAMSRFANIPYAAIGLWHGIAMWAITSVLSLPFVALLIPGVLSFISSWVSAGLRIPTTAIVNPTNIQNAATVTAQAALFVGVSAILTLAGSMLGGWLGSRRLRMGEAVTEEAGRERMAA